MDMKLGFDDLKLVVEYRTFRNDVRKLAGLVIVCAVFVFIMSLFDVLEVLDRSAKVPVLSPALLIISILVLVSGFWSFLSPTPASLLREGILCIPFSLGIIGFGVAMPFLGINDTTQGVILAIVMSIGVSTLFLAIRRLAGYHKTKQKWRGKPDTEWINSVDEAIDDIVHSKIVSNTALIAFRLGGKRWRGMLLQDAALLVMQRNRVLCVRREEVEITPKDDPRKDTLRALIRIGRQTGQGMIPVELFKRYKEWKAQHAGTDTSLHGHPTDA